MFNHLNGSFKGIKDWLVGIVQCNAISGNTDARSPEAGTVESSL
jgi:hypothetical protein